MTILTTSETVAKFGVCAILASLNKLGFTLTDDQLLTVKDALVRDVEENDALNKCEENYNKVVL